MRGVGKLRCSLATPLQSPISELRVHRSLLLADLFPKDLIGVAWKDLPTDHAPSDSHSVCEALSVTDEIKVNTFFACVSYCDGFLWVSDEPVDDMVVRALSVAKDVLFLGTGACFL